MPRITFERELRRLQDDILSLGSEVEENLTKAVDALIQRNELIARRLIDADKAVNEQRIRIGLDALTLIATQQPIARDMRVIAAVLEIVGELERIHDYIKGIGRITLMMGPETQLDKALLRRLPEMAQRASSMMRQALTAFANHDSRLARQIPAEDDVVDAMYKEIYQDIIRFVIMHPATIEEANLLEWALHNIERSADRVTNICEWVVYMVDGKYLEMDTEMEAPPELQK